MNRFNAQKMILIKILLGNISLFGMGERSEDNFSKEPVEEFEINDYSLSGFSKSVQKSLENLQQTFPEVPPSHYLRFAKAFSTGVTKTKFPATEMYRQHQQWRESQWPLLPPSDIFLPSEPSNFPKLWLQRGGKDRLGNQVLFIQGAAYDSKVATVDKYIERVLVMLDETFPKPGDSAKAIVLVDVRGYEGLPNPTSTLRTSISCII